MTDAVVARSKMGPHQPSIELEAMLAAGLELGILQRCMDAPLENGRRLIRLAPKYSNVLFDQIPRKVRRKWTSLQLEFERKYDLDTLIRVVNAVD